MLLFMLLVSIAWLRECVHLGLLHIAVSLFFFHLVSMDPTLPYFSKKPEETNADLEIND